MRSATPGPSYAGVDGRCRFACPLDLNRSHQLLGEDPSRGGDRMNGHRLGLILFATTSVLAFALHLQRLTDRYRPTASARTGDIRLSSGGKIDIASTPVSGYSHLAFSPDGLTL